MTKRSTGRRLGPSVLLTLFPLLLAEPTLAERSDVAVLDNGNEITGEVKSLLQGKLKFKTDHADTIYLQWEFVHGLTSKGFFEVEDEEGKFYYGSLGSGTDSRKLLVVGEETTVVLDMGRVVEITPIKKGFWDRVDGHLDLGLTYTGADDTLQYSFDAEATYRTKRYSETLKVNSIETRSGDSEDIVRNSIEFSYTRYHSKRYFGTGTASLTRNSELGIDHRLELGYQFGRYLIISNRNLLAGSVGVSGSHEVPSGPDPTSQAGWGLVGLGYDYFLYNFPKTNIAVDFSVQPGLTEWPRTRGNLSVSLRRELVKDFTSTLSVYDSYDSDPPTGANSKHDFVFIISLGWTF